MRVRGAPELWLRRTLRPALRKFSYYTSFPLVRPTNVVIYITDRCQLRCTTCSKWTTLDTIQEKELPTNEWKRILLMLKDWLSFYSVFFCGGEPFLRKDILELIDFAAEHNIPSSVVTNGYNIEPLAEHIVHSKLASLHVSLNGITPEVHDATRGTPGSLQNTMNAILKINQLRKQRQGEKLWLNIETILMPQNAQEILPLIVWAKEHDLDSIDVQILEDTQTFHSFSRVESLRKPEQSHISSSVAQQWNDSKKKGLTDVLDELIRQKGQDGFIATPEAQLRATKTYLQNPADILRIQCRVGIDSFIIDAYGNVRLCMNMSPIGSLLEKTPKQLWFSQSARYQRSNIKKCKMFCRLLTCNFSD